LGASAALAAPALSIKAATAADHIFMACPPSLTGCDYQRELRHRSNREGRPDKQSD